MNKRQLHHLWTHIRKISYGYLLIACIIFALTTVFSLRQNNLTALRLRAEVLKVDEQNGDTEAALRKLRQYVYGHMNTNLATSTSVYPPIQLKYRYDRLVAAEKARVEQAKGNVYNDAQVYCEKTSPESFFGAGRLPCIQSYIDSHPVTVKEQPIPDALYKYNFDSPAWSPDLAGWSMVLFIFFLIAFVLRFALGRWLKYELKSRL